MSRRRHLVAEPVFKSSGPWQRASGHGTGVGIRTIVPLADAMLEHHREMLIAAKMLGPGAADFLGRAPTGEMDRHFCRLDPLLATFQFQPRLTRFVRLEWMELRREFEQATILGVERERDHLVARHIHRRWRILVARLFPPPLGRGEGVEIFVRMQEGMNSRFLSVINDAQAQEVIRGGARGEGVGNSGGVIYLVTARNLRPGIADAKIGRVLDGMDETAGARAFGEAKNVTGGAADGGIGHGGILAGDGVFDQVTDAVVVGVVVGALLVQRYLAVGEVAGEIAAIIEREASDAESRDRSHEP